MSLRWEWKRFDDLTANEVYTILCVRQQVFVLEQECLYLDADGKDRKCFHLMGFDGDELVAYARIVDAGVSYEEVAMGRILTTAKARGTGAGIELMQVGLEHIKAHYGNVPIRISAQTYLLKFYEKFGFKSTGKQYLEDEIPHTEMLRQGLAKND
ncbi:MAG: GNAT family N-acetyltransferase [Flavobacteriales bacterium]|nr:GNAT family N-acetyltransferase [Flavobacteriales bacterium]